MATNTECQNVVACNIAFNMATESSCSEAESECDYESEESENGDRNVSNCKENGSIINLQASSVDKLAVDVSPESGGNENTPIVCKVTSQESTKGSDDSQFEEANETLDEELQYESCEEETYACVSPKSHEDSEQCIRSEIFSSDIIITESKIEFEKPHENQQTEPTDCKGCQTTENSDNERIFKLSTDVVEKNKSDCTSSVTTCDTSGQFVYNKHDSRNTEIEINEAICHLEHSTKISESHSKENIPTEKEPVLNHAHDVSCRHYTEVTHDFHPQITPTDNLRDSNELAGSVSNAHYHFQMQDRYYLPYHYNPVMQPTLISYQHGAMACFPIQYPNCDETDQFQNETDIDCDSNEAQTYQQNSSPFDNHESAPGENDTSTEGIVLHDGPIQIGNQTLEDEEVVQSDSGQYTGSSDSLSGQQEQVNGSITNEFVPLEVHPAPQQSVCYGAQSAGVTYIYNTPLLHPYNMSGHNANNPYVFQMAYPSIPTPYETMTYLPNNQIQEIPTIRPQIDIFYNGMHYYHPLSLPSMRPQTLNSPPSQMGFNVNPIMQNQLEMTSEVTHIRAHAMTQFNPGEAGQSFSYPAMYVSEAGLVTVLLKSDVSVEMTVEQTIRIVNHQRKLVVLTNSRGSVSYVFHPAAKIVQDQTSTEADIFLGRKVKFTTDLVSFANKFKCYKFDCRDIEETDPDFNDLTKDSSIAYLFSSECGDDIVQKGIKIANDAQYEQSENGSYVIRVNSVKIIQTLRGDVIVTCGPKFMKMSPSTAAIHLETHFVEMSIGMNWCIKMRRGSHTLNASHCGLVVSNGNIEAGFDQENRSFAFLLPRRVPLLDHRRSRRYENYRSRPRMQRH